jgi:hypothetical protein
MGVRRPMNVEPLDQRKKAKFVHVPEGIRPPNLFVLMCVSERSDEGVMEMRGRGHVPGTTSQAACQKAPLVVG